MKKHHKLAARKRIEEATSLNNADQLSIPAHDLAHQLITFEKEFAIEPQASNESYDALFTSSFFTEEFI